MNGREEFNNTPIIQNKTLTTIATKMTPPLALKLREHRTRRTTKFIVTEPQSSSSLIKDEARSFARSFEREVPSRTASFDSVDSFHSYYSQDSNISSRECNYNKNNNPPQRILPGSSSSGRRRGSRRAKKPTTTTPEQQHPSEKLTSNLPTPRPQASVAKTRTRRMSLMRSKSLEHIESFMHSSSSTSATRQYHEQRAKKTTTTTSEQQHPSEKLTTSLHTPRPQTSIDKLTTSLHTPRSQTSIEKMGPRKTALMRRKSLEQFEPVMNSSSSTAATRQYHEQRAIKTIEKMRTRTKALTRSKSLEQVESVRHSSSSTAATRQYHEQRAKKTTTATRQTSIEKMRTRTKALMRSKSLERIERAKKPTTTTPEQQHPSEKLTTSLHTPRPHTSIAKVRPEKTSLMRSKSLEQIESLIHSSSSTAATRQYHEQREQIESLMLSSSSTAATRQYHEQRAKKTTTTSPEQQHPSEKLTLRLPKSPPHTSIAKMRPRKTALMRSKSLEQIEPVMHSSSSTAATRQYHEQQQSRVIPYNNYDDSYTSQQNHHRLRKPRPGRKKPVNIVNDRDRDKAPYLPIERESYNNDNNGQYFNNYEEEVSFYDNNNNHNNYSYDHNNNNNVFPTEQQQRRQQQSRYSTPPQYASFPERILSRTYSSPEAASFENPPCLTNTRNDDHHYNMHHNSDNSDNHGNNNNSSTLWEPRQLVEILPGVRIPLHGSLETEYAIRKNCIQECTCFECDKKIVCVKEATMVVCPLCRSIFPTTFDAIAAATSNGDSLGLGLVK